MSDVRTTAGELLRGDSIRFPDDRGGKVWVSVSRTIINGPLVEILLADDRGAEYKTCAAARPVLRRARPGEAA